MMKAVVINQFGNAGVFEMAEVPRPVPGDRQVLIKVKAIGINPVDTKVRAGGHNISKTLKFPAILGWDVSGVIEECGNDVTEFKNGDAVFGSLGFPGLAHGYAEYLVANVDELALKPEKVSFEQAAALPIAGLTAWQSVYEHLAVKEGQSVLIQAAAGGVGHIAVQLAALAGAKVFATASGQNEEFVRSLGADVFIDYKREDFEKLAQNMDAVQDAMGGDVLYRSIGCVKPGGKIVCLPSSTKGDPVAIDLAEKANVSLSWIMMYKNSRQLAEMAALIANGKLKVHISKVFSFDEMAAAHEQIETHHTVGKVVVKVGGSYDL